MRPATYCAYRLSLTLYHMLISCHASLWIDNVGDLDRVMLIWVIDFFVDSVCYPCGNTVFIHTGGSCVFETVSLQGQRSDLICCL